MGFVVYISRSHDRAVIHHESCTWYRKRLGNRTRVGYWSEVFESYEKAEEFAKRSGRKRVENCKVCLKSGRLSTQER